MEFRRFPYEVVLDPHDLKLDPIGSSARSHSDRSLGQSWRGKGVSKKG